MLGSPAKFGPACCAENWFKNGSSVVLLKLACSLSFTGGAGSSAVTAMEQTMTGKMSFRPAKVTHGDGGSCFIRSVLAPPWIAFVNATERAAARSSEGERINDECWQVMRELM